MNIDIKNLRKIHNSIILTKTELKLPDGTKLYWEDIDSAFFNPIRGTMPELCIKTKRNDHIEKLLDWYLYADKNDLQRLFEKYARKKLF